MSQAGGASLPSQIVDKEPGVGPETQLWATENIDLEAKTSMERKKDELVKAAIRKRDPNHGKTRTV